MSDIFTLLQNPSADASALETYVGAAEALDTEFLSLCHTYPALSPRFIRVLEGYWGVRGRARKTLDQLAESDGITRERVRQIRNRAILHLRALLSRSEPYSIIVAVEIVKHCGGLVLLNDLVTFFERNFPRGCYSTRPFLQMLFASRVTRELRLFREDVVVHREMHDSLLDRAGQNFCSAIAAVGSVQIEALESAFPEDWPSLNEDQRCYQAKALASLYAFEVLPGVVSLRKWGRTEFAVFVLEHEGKALHFREIARRVKLLTGKDWSSTGFNSALNANTRFVRVGAGDFALAEWGAARYGRFDQVIERYLSSGRIAEHVDQISASTRRTYTVSEGTVMTMLAIARDKFQHFGGGFWGLRHYEPQVDSSLIATIVDILQRAEGPLSCDEIELRLPVSMRSTWPSIEVRRALFVSERIKRSKNNQNRTFSISV